MADISLIAGLGNPGAQYEATRHNAGYWFLDLLARRAGAALKPEGRFHGEACRITLHNHDCWLLKPTLFMNRSGQAVAALANFYKIPAEGILVIHDDLDIPAGEVRLKRGGGHGGHNGLRDILAQLGSQEFLRLRVGIGHPGQAREVTDYVLGKPSTDDKALIDRALAECLTQLPLIMVGELEKAMHHLHSHKP
ncbi:MAG: aminoacyl-tRNA hydrolase [Gammaproteobacteria bacterium RBG_16_57_12]|nr:MAG: aminoacyl-tRNA hydrolase [Gammaproteobacteria bacterium RBG_16_57_12]